MANVDITVRMIDKASEFAKKITASLRDIASGAKPLSASMENAGDAVSNFAMTNKTSLAILGALALALRKAVNDTVEYNSAIHELSMMSGESMESSSRLVQVLDDFKISTEQLTPIIKAMTAQGLTPNIETIAELSDRYKAIQDPVEKNAFLFRNFGRAGDELALAMNAGGEALRNMSAGVDENLLVTQKGYEETEKHRLALDELTDTLDGVKYAIGAIAIEPLTNALKLANKQIVDNTESLGAWLSNLIPVVSIYRLVTNQVEINNEETKEMELQQRNAAKSTQELGNSSLKTAEELKAEAEAMNILSEANKSMLSLTMSLQRENDGYSNSLSDLTQKQADLQAELDKANSQGNVKQIQELTEKYQENGLAIDELKAKHQDAMNAIAYGLLTAKLQADGFSDSEYQMAIAAGVALGQIDQATADLAIKLNDLAVQQEKGAITPEQYAAQARALTSVGTGAQTAAGGLQNVATGTTAIGTAADESKAKVKEHEEALMKMGDVGTTKVASLQKAFDNFSTANAVAQIDNVTAAVMNIPTEVDVTITQTTTTQTAESSDETSGYASGTNGKWLTVPQGFANDTYPIALTSGEKFMVLKPNEKLPQAQGDFFGSEIAASGNQVINIFAPVTLQIANADSLLGR